MRGVQNNPTSVALAANALRQQQQQQADSQTKAQGADIAGAQDTIYLCNFRVSVDGDWLCLKELQDDGSSGAAPSSGTQITPEGGTCNNSSTCGQTHSNASSAHNNDNDKSVLSCNNSNNKDKCVDEKIVERDWVNYYCRCHTLCYVFQTRKKQ